GRPIDLDNHLDVGGPAARDVAPMRGAYVWRPCVQAHLETEERAMKLTSAQVERALTQFEAQAIPDHHPVVPQLKDLFGEHTFFLDDNGLNIVEPAKGRWSATDSATVINLAHWSDASPNSLEPHEPEPTDVVIVLDSKH